MGAAGAKAYASVSSRTIREGRYSAVKDAVQASIREDTKKPDPEGSGSTV
jgi:hypothetical protein